MFLVSSPSTTLVQTFIILLGYYKAAAVVSFQSPVFPVSGAVFTLLPDTPYRPTAPVTSLSHSGACKDPLPPTKINGIQGPAV